MRVFPSFRQRRSRSWPDYWRRRFAPGLAVDLGLYLCSTIFAGVTALAATLPPHAEWGRLAVVGYALATLAVLGQLAAGHRAPTLTGTAARAVLTVAAWAATTLLPLVTEAAQRAGGQAGRAQEEVLVVEHGGQRLLDTGSPYLTRAAIAALPPDERLFGYLPYQPGMALFGLPRAIAGTAWYTDARVWFALVTAVTIGLGARLLLRSSALDRAALASSAGSTASLTSANRHAGTANPNGSPPAALVRAVQAATVLPICALTLAVGGDDLPVLGLCLLALCLAARRRFGASGVTVGLAGALKLFAWPVALVLFVLAVAARQGDRAGTGRPGNRPPEDDPDVAGRVRQRAPAPLIFAAGAFGLPVLALVPAFLVNRSAAVENVVKFPLGKGLVSSPAASPFPGHLITTSVPDGRVIAAALLVLAGVAIAIWLVRRPPRDAADAAGVCAIGLLAATLLMPATRFGYLLYPIAYAVWIPVLRVQRRRRDLTDAERGGGGVDGYQNRAQAGDVLAAGLRQYAGRPDVCVLGLVRGGVPVAARVAGALRAPLDALVVRKLGVPLMPELAFGALGPGGVRVLNDEVAGGLDEGTIEDVTRHEANELARREALYRGGRAPLRLGGRTVIIVDDGLATGATAQAAVATVRSQGAARVVLAAPVGSKQAVEWLRTTADEVVCPLVPEVFGAVGQFFASFEQVTDETVTALLAQQVAPA